MIFLLSLFEHLVKLFFPPLILNIPEIVLDRTRDRLNFPLGVFQLHISACLWIWRPKKKKKITMLQNGDGNITKSKELQIMIVGLCVVIWKEPDVSPW